MKIWFDKIFLVYWASMLLYGCNSKSPQSTDNQPVVQDVTSYWLDNEQNYNDRTTTGYLDTFVKYYSSNVAANNTNRYLGLLKSYASTVNGLEVTDSFLLRTCLECMKITPENVQNQKHLDYLKFTIGNQYYFLGNNPEAKVWLLKATEAADTINFTKNLPSCYMLLGNIAFMENQYELAIAYYLRAVEFYEKLNDRDNISTTYVNIANCYSALHSSYYFHYYTNKAIAIAVSDNNLKNALKYRLKKAYFSFTETNNSSNFVQDVNAITSAFNDMPEKNNRLSFQVMGAGVQNVSFSTRLTAHIIS
ncbi:MAG: tetratricopeptide repeat protein [Bacteroidales bacterium]|nr:tetratricopeptide repeat protein [Bacteroidales bacterium]